MFPIVSCLRKSPHLIAEFHWSLNLCNQVKNQITAQLINGLSIILLGNYPCKYDIQIINVNCYQDVWISVYRTVI